MKQIGELLPQLFDTSHLKIEIRGVPKRKDLVKLFIDRLNADLKETNRRLLKQGTKLYPVKSDSFYAWKLSHVPTHDLKPFYDECCRGEFGKVFYGALKVKSAGTPYQVTK